MAASLAAKTKYFSQPHQGNNMAIYELRTYSAIVGKMTELTALYTNEGWPALAKHPQKLVGYFTGDVGAINELIHMWKFDDDADRRAFWAGVFADPEFMAFAAKIRPLIREQNNKLMLSAPWGPQP
jgi:NIPSNAP